MHTLEPYYAWRNHYIASEDPRSPFFDREYSEFEYSTKVYNYFIHPQWDTIHSPTLFCKILFVDYEERFAILEFIGEWNDCLYNDIMQLKREVVDVLQAEGIHRFILIGENVLNFHFGDDCYYVLGGELSELSWRTLSPAHLYERVDNCVSQRLGFIG